MRASVVSSSTPTPWRRAVSSTVYAPQSPVWCSRAPDGDDHAGALAGTEHDVLRAGRAVDVVPGSQRPLFALDEEERLAGDDQEPFLVGLAVVHADGVAGREHEHVDPDLGEVPLDLLLGPAGQRQAEAATLAAEPARVALR